LRRKLWLKKDEILLEKKNKKLFAYVLGKENNSGEERAVPYLWMSCLISSNVPELSEVSGTYLKSPDELGRKPLLTATVSVSTVLPDEVVEDIEQYAPIFLRFIGKLHDKYIDIVKENNFLTIALDYFYEAEKKFVYNNEGFISAMISMEALFNEGPSDIKYKLSHRAAFVLGLSGLEASETFEKLKVFYNNRSSLVHGVGSLKHDPNRSLISKYTRRALIIFMILLKNNNRRSISREKRKKEILREIDYAMFDEDSRKSLKNEISKGLRDFNLKIPRKFEGEIDGRDYRVTAW